MSSSTLETFPNPRPERDFEIAISCPEFTSVCPKTGLPDFGEIRITYVPDATCVELKSLKYYMIAFRNRGIFYEAVTNQILDDLVQLLHPRRMTVIGDFSVRGGIKTVVTAGYDATTVPRQHDPHNRDTRTRTHTQTPKPKTGYARRRAARNF
jgi:7-cyano-7-deazaguanine reductase